MPWGPGPTIGLILPDDAGPSDPRIVIGDVSFMPADLIAYYTAATETIIGGLVFFRGTNVSYTYMIFTVRTTFANLCIGSKSDTGLIAEIVRTRAFGNGFEFIAQFIQSVFPKTVGMRLANGTNFAVDDGPGASSQVAFNGTTSVQLNNSATFNVLGATSVIDMFTAGALQIFRTGTTLQLNVGSTFLIDGRNQGRGVQSFAVSSANSAGIVNPNTGLMLTGNSMTFRNGRAYRFSVNGAHFSSVAGLLATYTFSRGAGGFTLNAGNFRTEGGSSTAVHASKIATRTGADIIDSPTLLLTPAAAGTVTMFGSATLQRHITVEDIGLATDFPGAVAIA